MIKSYYNSKMRDFEFWFYRLMIHDLCSDAYDKYGDSYFEVMRIESRGGKEGIYIAPKAVNGANKWADAANDLWTNGPLPITSACKTIYKPTSHANINTSLLSLLIARNIMPRSKKGNVHNPCIALNEKYDSGWGQNSPLGFCWNNGIYERRT